MLTLVHQLGDSNPGIGCGFTNDSYIAAKEAAQNKWTLTDITSSASLLSLSTDQNIIAQACNHSSLTSQVQQ